MPAARKKEKEEAIRLRTEERLSINEIRAKIPDVSKGSLSAWLRPYPLTADERRQKISKPNIGNQHRGPDSPKAAEAMSIKSKYYDLAGGAAGFSTVQKGKIAEIAVAMRLAIQGFRLYASPFDGDGIDWVVERPDGRLARLEVRWASRGLHGLPVISLRKSDGRRSSRRMCDQDTDFVVGYDLYSDVAFVFSIEETKGRNRMISVDDDSTEAWHKLLK